MDGAHLQVCENCKNYGTLTNEPQKPYQSKSREIIRPRQMKIRHKSATPYIPEDFVTEDFPRIIREGRIKHDLSQKELASKINERLSVIQKVELGKLSPDLMLCKKLENMLKIKLIIQKSNEELSTPISGKIERTLGDVVHIKKKNESSVGL